MLSVAKGNVRFGFTCVPTIRHARTITLGYREASVPFSYLNPARQPIGYSIELCLVIVEDIRGELRIAGHTRKARPQASHIAQQLLSQLGGVALLIPTSGIHPGGSD